MRFSKRILIPFLCILNSSSYAKDDNCYLQYRPSENEVVFAKINSPLKVADEICDNRFLNIPFTQKKGAVTLYKGDYRFERQDGDTYIFSLKSTHNDIIKSCLLCDGLKRVEVNLLYSDILCVRSKINIKSCAIKNKAKFSIVDKSRIYENICTPSLKYYGIENNILKFGYNTCDTSYDVNQNVLNLDLNQDNTITFQNDIYIIEKATDKGLVYRIIKRED